MRRGILNNIGVPISLTGAAVAALLSIKALFFNDFSADDANMAQLSLGILKSQFAVPFLGNFLEASKYFLTYPPLHPAITAVIFKLFGASYLTSKFVPMVSMSMMTVVIAVYTYRVMAPAVALIVTGLAAFDHVLFMASTWNRPDMLACLLVTLSAVSFVESEKRSSLRMLIFSGSMAGFAFLSSYRSVILIIAFAGYAACVFRSNGVKAVFKKAAAYLGPVFLINIPWYAWIASDATRRVLFINQLAGSTAGANGHTASQVIRNLLNPAADLYLSLFRDGSPFALIIACLIFLYVNNVKRSLYQIMLLGATFAMLVLNLRGSYNLILAMPFFYIEFGRFIDSVLKRKSGRAVKYFVAAFAGIALFAGVAGDLRMAFGKPDIKPDADYCTFLLHKYTKPGSRVATDPIFIMADSGDRKILDAGLLIWEQFRKKYASYSEITGYVVNADYIILSDRLRKWGELPVEQSVKFREYLKQECVFADKADDGFHGPYWIYKCRGRG